MRRAGLDPSDRYPALQSRLLRSPARRSLDRARMHRRRDSDQRRHQEKRPARSRICRRSGTETVAKRGERLQRLAILSLTAALKLERALCESIA